MAMIMKLESGHYINLDNLVVILAGKKDGTFKAVMTTDKDITLSPDDLEKIEQGAGPLTYSLQATEPFYINKDDIKSSML